MHVEKQAYKVDHLVKFVVHMVARIEGQMGAQRYDFGTFLDIDRVFSTTSYQATCGEADMHGVSSMMVLYCMSMMGRMLCDRNLVADHKGVRVRSLVSRGYSERGVLSPLMWCLVFDRLIHSLNRANYYT